MTAIRFAKVVASLPAALDPHTLYLVRAGAGFDLHLSDATGAIAYPVNAPLDAWPRRSATPKIVGDVNGTALTTQALTAARQYFVPFTVPRRTTLTGLRLSVTTAATGLASIGLYGNTQVAGDDAPGSLLASVTGLNTGSTGDKTGSLNVTLLSGQLYWVSLIASAAATVRALSVAGVQAALGRTPNNTTVISHLYAAGSGSTLPATAPTTLTAGTGNCPAIYLVE